MINGIVLKGSVKPNGTRITSFLTFFVKLVKFHLFEVSA
jgi:hypothetical protein